MKFFLDLLFLMTLLVLSAFFAAAETALFSLSKMERRRLTQAHPVISKWVLYHLDHPRRALGAILISNLVVNTLAASMVTIFIIEYAGPSKLGIGLTVFTVLSIFFGEILPKTLAVRKNQTVALISALPIHVFAAVLKPFRWLVRVLSDAVLSLVLREKKEHSDQFSQEELKTLVKIGEEEGVLDSQERYMLQKLLDLGERPVKDIMTPRVSVAALDADESIEKHVTLIRKYHFSHFPVFQNTIDNLLGVVPVQEYMLNPGQPVQTFLKQPLFIPEIKRIDDLLAEFRLKNQNFAVCVDEYGGTAGIVTLEDILEEIFGEFYDEYAKVENPIRSLGHNEFFVEAKIPLADFNEFFTMDLKAKDASTLAGFILEQIGEVPEKGRVLKASECEIRIHDVIRHRSIRSVIVRPTL